MDWSLVLASALILYALAHGAAWDRKTPIGVYLFARFVGGLMNLAAMAWALHIIVGR